MPDRRTTTRGKVRAEHHSTIEGAAFASDVTDHGQARTGDTRCADVWCTASSVGSQGVLGRRLLALAARKPAARTATSANPLPCEAG